MASQGKKNDKKKYMFKEGSNPLFPISHKIPNQLDYSASALKLNVKMDINKLSKKLTSNILPKKIHEISRDTKNYKDINKTYSSSKQKGENQPIKLNNIKLSKIRPLDFPSNIKEIGVAEKYKYISSNNKKGNLSTTKEKNKTEIIDYKNLLNYKLSPQNLANYKNINFNNYNNAYSVRKPILNKNIIELNSANNSFYKKIIINNNSSTNIKANFNFIKPKKQTNNLYLKTDKYDRDIKTPKESKVKLIFNNKNIEKKLEDIPIDLKRKESSLPLEANITGNDLKFSLDKNLFNGEYKLHLKRSKKNFSNENNIINMNLNNYININKDEELILEQYRKKKNQIMGPEDLHFYYINALQEGKKNENKFEKD